MKIKEYFLIGLFLTFCFAAIYFWANQYTISTLEDTRMNRAHQALHSYKQYFPHFYQWLQDLKKNQIVEFSLGYILPTPFMFLLGDIDGFRLAHILAAGVTTFFVYLILRQHLKYSPMTALMTIMILLTSYGFIFLSTYTVLDQFAFMFFFGFVYFFFKNNNFLAGLLYLAAILSKDPRIILASVPGLIIFILFFDRRQLSNRKNWFIVFICLTIFLFIQKVSGGPAIDAFPFSLISNSSHNNMNAFLKYFGPFNLGNMITIFFTAPILTTAAILGLGNLSQAKSFKLEKLLLLSFLTIMVIYFCATTSGSHYIYFVFPFLAIFAARFLKKTSLLNKTIFFFLSLIILLFSLHSPRYFARMSLKEIEKLKQELLPYSNQGFILSHGFDWGRYFHDRRWSNIWDCEWTGTSTQIKTMSSDVEKNIKLVAVNRGLMETFLNWENSKNFIFYKSFNDWLFFIPLKNEENNF